jgi:hypothetical protein
LHIFFLPINKKDEENDIKTLIVNMNVRFWCYRTR